MSGDEWHIVAESASEARTKSLAASLAACCRMGDIILLQGDLGAGKTAFARGFIHSLQNETEEVVSPTFLLAQRYSTRQAWPVWHFDLYRLKHPSELAEIGFEEALQEGVTLIEWPERMGYSPPPALTVELAYGQDAAARRIRLSGDAAAWKSRLEKLRDTWS